MDVYVTRRGQPFVWDADKAAINLAKHGVAFEDAIPVFFDFLARFEDASVEGEKREAAIGLGGAFRLLYVVHLQRQDDCIRIVSARFAGRRERRDYEDNG